MLPPGSRVGRYETIELVGRGGMGVVYRALDPVLRREIALKVIAPAALTDADGARRSSAVGRLLREARACAALRHPCVVDVYDAGVSEGVPFIAMELVKGRSLRQLLPATDVGLSTRLQWLLDVASALCAAHSLGLVHRDIKPSNVMVTPDGGIKVLDFGLARPLSREDEPASFRTVEGAIVGTPRYAAPEQLAGEPVDARADQFSWGVLAYTLLAGRHPADVAGAPPGTPAALVGDVPALDLVATAVSRGTAEVVARAMAPRAQDRFGSMREIEEALESALGTTFDATVMPAPATEGTSDDLLGGRYELLEEIGRGGASVVYRARDKRADDVVALKLIAHGDVSEQWLRLARRELHVARRVTHPNVVRIHDLVELPGRFGLSMELVEGESLDRRLARGPMSRDEVVALAGDLARALAAAHEAGVVHRDLKPANVLLRKDGGRAVVTDFGVSRAFESREPPLSSKPGGAGGEGTWGAGGLIGTPRYMAPEQLEGGAVGPRADVYAFGLVVFEAATGERLHDAETLGALRRRRRQERPPRLRDRRKELPRPLCDTVDRALSQDAAQRPADGRELALALEGGAHPHRSSRAVVVASVAVAAAALVIAGVARWRTPSSRASKEPAIENPTSPSTPHLTLQLSNARRVTFGPGCQELPAFSADGNAIAYDNEVGSDAALFLQPLSGGPPSRLVPDSAADYFAHLSPDGSRVAFLRSDNGHMSAWVAPLDGREPPRPVGEPATRIPSWSRDGRGIWAGDGATLAEFDAATGTPLARVPATDVPRSAQFVELSDGRLVGVAPACPDCTVSGVFLHDRDGRTRWLLDGRVGVSIATTPDERHALVFRESPLTGMELVDVPLDGSPAAPVAPALVPDLHDGLALSSDGRRLAWSTCRSVDRLGWADPKGGFHQVGSDDLGVVDSMAPTGRDQQLLVVSMRAGKREPWIVDPGGGAPPRRADSDPRGARQVAVSSDGAWYVKSTVGDGIYLGALSGEPALRRLTDDPTDCDPAFRHGDREVLFTRRSEDGTLQVMGVPVEGGTPRALLGAGSRSAWSSPLEDLVVYHANHVPMLWDGKTGAARRLSPALGEAAYRALRFSPDGRRVAASRTDGTVLEVDVKTGSLLRTISLPSAGVFAYTSRGLLLAREESEGSIWAADAVIH